MLDGASNAPVQFERAIRLYAPRCTSRASCLQYKPRVMEAVARAMHPLTPSWASATSTRPLRPYAAIHIRTMEHETTREKERRHIDFRHDMSAQLVLLGERVNASDSDRARPTRDVWLTTDDLPSAKQALAAAAPWLVVWSIEDVSLPKAVLPAQPDTEFTMFDVAAAIGAVEFVASRSSLSTHIQDMREWRRREECRRGQHERARGA